MKRTTPTLGTVKRQRTVTKLVADVEVIDDEIIDVTTLERVPKRAPTFWERLTTPPSRVSKLSERTKPEVVMTKREPLPPLSLEQNSILSEILNGNGNVLITGGAGTGKSRMIHAIYEGLAEQIETTIKFDARDNAVETKKKRWGVKVMAPTGLAALLLPNGQTYHRTLSCGVSTSIHKMVANATEYKKNIKFSQWTRGGKRYAFILDEAFMVSGQQMDRLDAMMRQLSQCDAPFGGHRIILVGDPYQLGPVTQSEGFLFSSGFFQFVSKKYVLTQCFRQEDIEFVSFLDRIRRGVPEPADHDKLRKLGSGDVSKHVKLVPTKKQAFKLNQDALDAMPGKSRVYRAQDTVYDRSYAGMLDDMRVPACLELKLGSRVMFVRNINSVVVNGTTGVVASMDTGSIDIRLDRGGIFTATKFEFTVTKRDKTLVKRVAFPIVLADAINIHQSQGLSLDNVYVDCDRIFACGQLYVALSRCRTEQGLVVKNYHPSAIKVNADVEKFMQSLY